MEITHHVTDDLRGLRVLSLRAQATVEHAVDDPTLHRLQAVAGIGQCTRDDDRHRVVEEGALDLFLDLDGLGAGSEGLLFVGHEGSGS